jgi:hypothetical protein
MQPSRSTLGAALAIVAGMFCLFIAHWWTPTGTALFGDLTAAWTVGLLLIGAAFVVAPFVAGRNLWAARALLIVPALALFASGVFFGVASGQGPATAWNDFIPAILGLVAAFFVGPRVRPEVQRARQAERAGQEAERQQGHREQRAA